VIAHNPVMFHGRPSGKRIVWIPTFGGEGARPSHRARLALIQGLRFWQMLRDDLIDLGAYVRAVTQQVRRVDVERGGAELGGVPKSWPRRPRLRLSSRIQEIKRTLGRANPPSTRSTPRKPSRG
jgi:hypothetical protein